MNERWLWSVLTLSDGWRWCGVGCCGVLLTAGVWLFSGWPQWQRQQALAMQQQQLMQAYQRQLQQLAALPGDEVLKRQQEQLDAWQQKLQPRQFSLPDLLKVAHARLDEWQMQPPRQRMQLVLSWADVGLLLDALLQQQPAVAINQLVLQPDKPGLLQAALTLEVADDKVVAAAAVQ